MVNDFKYPVIAFAKGGILHFARNADDMTICSRRGWKNGFYNGLNVLDCEGSSYKVREAEKVENVGFLWGFSFLLGQKIRVRLNYTKVEKEISVDDFKEKIIKVLKRDRHFWDSGGTLEEIITITKSAKSHGDVIKYLTGIFYKETEKGL
ncbi:hypothetical protein FAZ19_15840 [Sphingobacterium alkalisoli]|uniref:Uncharacterized protein n=2 Tax=Sphingobacterium alkalisoli TaxID=1874115 RepID=A0A4U0GX50_9SPHI|nr:hypothetical protein FAZ19_15840 [Sphingobacterium alkalisoli]